MGNIKPQCRPRPQYSPALFRPSSQARLAKTKSRRAARPLGRQEMAKCSRQLARPHSCYQQPRQRGGTANIPWAPELRREKDGRRSGVGDLSQKYQQVDGTEIVALIYQGLGGYRSHDRTRSVKVAPPVLPKKFQSQVYRESSTPRCPELDQTDDEKEEQHSADDHYTM